MRKWLDPTEQAAWTGLLQLTSQLRTELNRQLADEHAISLTDYEVLARLSASPRSGLRIRDLMETLDWEQSRLSHHLARMDKRGLVSKQECDEDRRGSFFVLTTIGRAAIEKAAPSHVAHVRQLLFDHLTSEQVEQLAAVTGQALQRLDERRP